MLETISGFLMKLLGPVSGDAIKKILVRIRRPKVQLSRAPANILEHIAPGAPADRVRELLGSPHKAVSSVWSYRFEDLLLTIEFWKGGSVRTVLAGVAKIHKRARFKIYPLEFELGTLVLSDVVADGFNVRLRTTNKTEELLVQKNYGMPGNHWYFTFGALWAPYIYQSDFKWDYQKNKLNSDPSEVLMNWVAISESSDEVWFDYSMFC